MILPESIKPMSTKILFIFFTFFFIGTVQGQNFSELVSDKTMSISAKAYNGFYTEFDFNAKNVERGWWDYSRSFGRPLNMRGYYKVTIPSDVNSGTVDLVLLSRTVSGKNSCGFFLCLDESNISKDKILDYKKQLKVILKDFKKTYYIEQLEDVLEQLEKKAIKTSKKVSKAKGKSKERFLQDLETQQEHIAQTKAKLKEIYNAF